MKQQRIRGLATAVLSTMLVAFALVVNARLAAVNLRRVTEADASVRHTHEVRETLQGFLLSLQDAETAERGFIITGDAKYLDLYSGSRALALDRLEKLAKLTGDNLSQQRLVDTMRPLVVQKLAVLERAIGLRRTAADGPVAARAIVQSGESKRLMDALRGIVAEMDATENQLLTDRVRTSSVAGSAAASSCSRQPSRSGGTARASASVPPPSSATRRTGSTPRRRSSAPPSPASATEWS